MIVSIAMTTYNGARYLREQLDSILTQNYSDFELVICDDCSTDNTWAILAEYAEKDTRVHCRRNDKNLGYTKNFEKAITLCRGDYIALSDQDDVWTPDHLAVLLENRSDALLVWAQAEFILQDGTPTGEKRLPASQVAFLAHNDNDLFRTLFFCCPAQGCTMLVNRILLEKAMPFVATRAYDPWLTLAAASLKKLRYVDKTIVWYRIHDTNVSQPSLWSSRSLGMFQRIRKKFAQYKTPAAFLRFLVLRPFKNNDADQKWYKEWVQRCLDWLDLFFARFAPDLTAEQSVIFQGVKRYFLALANRTDFFYKITYFQKYGESICLHDNDGSKNFKRIMRKKFIFLTFRFKGL
ncbi:hypothetical protein FACS189485_09860 [Spirochaetia bacterium]|nr:hypothetical protein FACS189485_09860 [Spirochaetia bacterium]